MLHQISKEKLLFAFSVFFLVILNQQRNVYALDANYETACEELQSTSWTDAPSPMAIICPVVRLLNVIILSAAAVFIIFIFITSIKFALSQGNPDALKASQQALTTSVIGFIIIIGVYTILTIAQNILGLQNSILTDPFKILNDNLYQLLTKMGIT